MISERRVDAFEKDLKRLVWGWEQSAQEHLENQWNFERSCCEEANINWYNLSVGSNIISLKRKLALISSKGKYNLQICIYIEWLNDKELLALCEGLLYTKLFEEKLIEIKLINTTIYMIHTCDYAYETYTWGIELNLYLKLNLSCKDIDITILIDWLLTIIVLELLTFKFFVSRWMSLQIGGLAI